MGQESGIIAPQATIEQVGTGFALHRRSRGFSRRAGFLYRPAQRSDSRVERTGGNQTCGWEGTGRIKRNWTSTKMATWLHVPTYITRSSFSMIRKRCGVLLRELQRYPPKWSQRCVGRSHRRQLLYRPLLSPSILESGAQRSAGCPGRLPPFKGWQSERVSDQYVQPNGIIGTPDGKALYVADINDRKIWKYDIQTDGSLQTEPFSHRKDPTG